jgi:hypothetical protein
MKKYEIPITWQSIKVYKVEADNLQEGITKALKQFFNEPDEGYLEDSFDVDGIIEDNYPDEDYDINKVLKNI